MKACACVAALVAVGLLAAGQASACPGAKGAPIIPNQAAAYELLKLALPQILPGYGIVKAEAAATGHDWLVTAQVAAAGAASDRESSSMMVPPGVLTARIEGCHGGVVEASFKPNASHAPPVG